MYRVPPKRDPRFKAVFWKWFTKSYEMDLTVRFGLSLVIDSQLKVIRIMAIV